MKDQIPDFTPEGERLLVIALRHALFAAWLAHGADICERLAETIWKRTRDLPALVPIIAFQSVLIERAAIERELSSMALSLFDPEKHLKGNF